MKGQKLVKYAASSVIILSVLLPKAAYIAVVALLMLHIYQDKSAKLLGAAAANRPLAVLLFTVLLSTVFSHAKVLSVAADSIILLLFVFYAMLLADGESQGEEDYFKLLSCLNILVCLYGGYQFLTLDLAVRSSWVDQGSYGNLVRIYATFGNPNVLGGYLAMHLSFAVARLKEKKNDYFVWTSTVLSSLCLLLTYSRGAFGGFCAAMLTLYSLRRKKGLLIYTTVMTAAFIYINQAGTGMNRADLLALSSDSSSLYRLEIWKSACGLFLKSPLTGNGFGTAWYFLAEGSDKLMRYVLHAHNVYLQIAAEMGIIGLSAAAFFIFGMLKRSIQLLKFKAKLKDRHWIEGFVAMMAAGAVHGLVDAVVFLPVYGMVLVTYYTLSARILNKYDALIRKTASEQVQLDTQDEIAI